MNTKKRILIADSSSFTMRQIFENKCSENYEIRVADTATETLSAIKLFKPHLIFVELLLPEMDGIEILKRIKTSDETKSTGVVILTSLVMLQNYNASIAMGADYFLVKPFDTNFFFQLIDRFFAGTLKPEPFNPSIPHYDQNSPYHPIVPLQKTYLKFWGTRGSSPVAGYQYVKYGGNTCCLEIRHGDDLIIIDAGTGIRDLGMSLARENRQKIHMFFSHTHWDHITGFPFFQPLTHQNCTAAIWSPIGYEKSTHDLFQDMMSFGYFPIRLEELRAKIEFYDLRDHNKVQIGNLTVESHHAKHPGPTLCFKIRSPGKTIGYITDNEVLLGYHGHPLNIGKDHPLLEPHLSLIDFLSDCHMIIHEAQYFPEEYHDRVGWGHSSVSNATALLRHLKCNEWIVTHHNPSHTDETLDYKLQLHQEVLAECNLDIRCDMAFDGMIIPL